MSGPTNKNNFNQDGIGQVPSIAAQKTFYAGPVSGADSTPTFRTIALTDLPAGNNNFNNLNTYGPLYATSATSVTTLNPAGSSTGYPFVSGGTGSAPFYSNQPALFRLTYNGNASYVIDGDGSFTGTYGSLLLKGLNGTSSGALFFGDANCSIWGNVGNTKTVAGAALHLNTSDAIWNLFQTNYYLYRASVLAFMVGPSGRIGINYTVGAGDPWLTVDTQATNVVGLRIKGSGADVGAGLELNNTTAAVTNQIYTNSSGEFAMKRSGNAFPFMKANVNDAIAFNNSYGTSGQLLMSTGTAGAPQWTSITNVPQNFQRITLNNTSAFPAISIDGNFPSRITINNTNTPAANPLSLKQMAGNELLIGKENTSDGVLVNPNGAIGYRNTGGIDTYGTAGQVFTTNGSGSPFSYKSLVTTAPLRLMLHIGQITNTYFTLIGSYSTVDEFVYNPFARDASINSIEMQVYGAGGGGASCRGAAAADDCAGGGGGGGAYANFRINRGQVPGNGFNIFLAKGGLRGDPNGTWQGLDASDTDLYLYQAPTTLFLKVGGGKGGEHPNQPGTLNLTWGRGGAGGIVAAYGVYGIEYDLSAGLDGGNAYLLGDGQGYSIASGGSNGRIPGVVKANFNNVASNPGKPSYTTEFRGCGGTGATRRSYSSNEVGGYGGDAFVHITEYYDVKLV